MAALKLLIVNLCDGLNVGKNMGKEQIEEACRLVYKDWFGFSVDHFIEAFDRFKSNHYPEIKIFDRFDVLIIFAILERFNEDLIKERKKAEEEEKRKQEEEWEKNAVPMPEEVKVGLENLVKKMRANVYAKPIKPMNEEQKLFNSWIKEFDELWKNNPMKTGLKMIRFKGKKLDLNAYLEHKLEYHNAHINSLNQQTK